VQLYGLFFGVTFRLRYLVLNNNKNKKMELEKNSSKLDKRFFYGKIVWICLIQELKMFYWKLKNSEWKFQVNDFFEELT